MSDRPNVPPAGGEMPPGFSGVHPLQPGTHAVDEEKKKDDDTQVVAGTFDQAVAAEKAAAVRDKPNLLPDFKLKHPGTVDIESLPPDQRVKYQKMLDDTKETLKALNPPEAVSPPTLDPTHPSAVPPPALAPGPAGLFTPVADEAESVQEEAVTTAKQPDLCLNCGWDQAVTDVIEVTDDDKIMWLRHILSGDRFQKDYELFGGRMVVTFRSRNVGEQDMISTQMSFDQKLGRMESPVALQVWMYWWARYNLAVSLQKITYHSDDGPPRTTQYGEVIGKDDKPYEEVQGKESPVRLLTIGVMAQFDDYVYNAVLEQSRLFDQLCGRLMALSRDPDFFVKPRGGNSS